MKKIIFLILLIPLIFNNIKSQTVCNYKNELNLGFINIYDFKSKPKFGIGFKRYVNENILRFSLNYYYYYKAEFQNDTFNNVFLNYAIIPKIGIEKQKSLSKFVLFYGSDFVYEYKNEYSYFDNAFFNYNDISYNSIIIIKNGIGLAPFVGLKYFIADNISISTELNSNCFFLSIKNYITPPILKINMKKNIIRQNFICFSSIYNLLF